VSDPSPEPEGVSAIGVTSLAEALRARTEPAHRQVERTPFVRDLLGGRVGRAGYCLLLSNLHGIYAPLEAALARHAAHPSIAPVYAPALFRRSALEHDLDYLHGARWPDELPALPATRAYAQRLHELGASSLELLVAHAYVRYLGDLSGGQVVRRIVARALALAGAAGTRFYDFGEPDAAAALARRFRAGLDAITQDPARQEAIVSEAAQGFCRHAELFDELALACAS
jgi:heme oxygenase (biliverdin-producing, ferredoxin)